MLTASPATWLLRILHTHRNTFFSFLHSQHQPMKYFTVSYNPTPFGFRALENKAIQCFSVGEIYAVLESEYLYRHTSFYCTWQILCFLQTEGLWQPCIEQVYQCPFSDSIRSLCVTRSHVVILIVFQTFSILLYYYICYGDL